MLFTALAAGVTAIVTGIVTYFAVSPSTSKSGNSGATAEIRNDVKIEEKEVDPHSIITNVLLTIITIIKLIELILYFVNRCRNTFKKKYERKAAITPSAPTIV